MPEATVHCVIDTEVLVHSNAPVSRHASVAQKERWALLGKAIQREYVPACSVQLVQEYVAHLKGRRRNDLVQAFITALDRFGKRNYAALTRHERADLRTCRYPSHDEHLIHTAKGLTNVMIAVEESPILLAADCVNSSRCRLDVKILRTGEILAKLK